VQVEVEKYLEEQDLPYTVFQPQYIYGPYTNKDCEQWFVDRIIRCRVLWTSITTMPSVLLAVAVTWPRA
jgi:hypothetical protein